MTRNAERLAAVQQLLERPDEASMRRRRGHRVTHAGSRDRFTRTWLPAVRVWSERHLATFAGVVDGWHPAEKAAQQSVTSVHHVRRIRIFPICLN